MNNENQRKSKSTPFRTFLLWLLSITVILVAVGGVKQIYDGYKEAERQVELQKQQVNQLRKNQKKYKYVTKEKYNTITSVLNKRDSLLGYWSHQQMEEKAVEGLAVQLTSSYGRDRWKGYRY